MAPARPSGTSMPLRLSAVHQSLASGTMQENGTSTRPASLAALPTVRRISLNRSAGGGASTFTASGPKSGCSQTKCPSAQRSTSASASRSGNWKLRGSGSFVSTLISTNTPQRAPLATMLLMRCAAASEKLAGKLATTSTRYGSAISPAKALYSSIEWNSLRRYTWMTFSMCLVRSARRCSMWLVSVQMRLATNCSSKSARCMKAEKLSPSPTGSMIVKRTLPGGIAVNRRSIALCMTSTARARPGPSAFSNSSERRGKGNSTGSAKSSLRRPKPLVLGHAAVESRPA